MKLRINVELKVVSGNKQVLDKSGNKAKGITRNKGNPSNKGNPRNEGKPRNKVKNIP